MEDRKKRALGRFVRKNALAAGGILLFLLLDRFRLFDAFLFCPWHTVGLYCPTCGLTRASHALLSFDILAALRYNFLIFPLLGVIGYYEVVALCRARRGEENLLKGASRLPLGLLLLAFGLFFVVRNVLLLCGIDPLGDFLAG